MAELVAAFSTPESLIQLVMLAFLEIILGIDNIVFISITADRLPAHQQSLGRRLGLAAALVTRVALLFTIGWVMALTQPLFTVAGLDVSGKNLILLVGGAYLIYKGFTELKETLALHEEREALGHPDHVAKPALGLGRAVATIAFMDIVFSLDSVITAVGMVNHVVIAALAIVIAIVFMMVFADAVSGFINKNPEIKILALFFILAIGVMLVLEFFHIEIPKAYLYVAMIFSLVVTLIQMAYARNLEKMHAELAKHAASQTAGEESEAK